MASFTGVGDNTELAVEARGETVDIAISGTYNMTILFQREVGAPSSGAWETINTYTTADATVAATYVTQGDKEVLRLIVTVDTSGTATASLASTSNLSVHDVADVYGNKIVEFTQETAKWYVGHEFAEENGVVNITAATLTATALGHAGRTVTLNRAAGVTVTLPAASGSGNIYRFYTGTTVTSNNNIIQAASSSDSMSGGAWVSQDGADTVNMFEAASTSDTITMNGTTKGGLLGDMIIITDVASGKFHVQAMLSATGTEATPFSAAV